MQRTEADILSKAPIKVKFGETEYDVRPLTIRPAREWRLKVSKEMSETLKSFNADANPGTLAPGLGAAMIAFPEKLLEIIMAFAPYLDREKIEVEATDEQLAVAYGKVMALGFPFLAPLMMTQTVLKSSQ